MKKEFVKYVTLCLISWLLISSCSTLRVEKRHYRKGLNVQLIKHDKPKKYEDNLSSQNEDLTDNITKKEESIDESDKMDNNAEDLSASINNDIIYSSDKNKQNISNYNDSNYKNKIQSASSKKRSDIRRILHSKKYSASDDDNDPVIKIAKKAILYFFLGFIPYAGTFFAIASVVLAIIALNRAKDSSNPQRVRKMVTWIIYVNVLFLLLFFSLLLFILSMA